MNVSDSEETGLSPKFDDQSDNDSRHHSLQNDTEGDGNLKLQQPIEYPDIPDTLQSASVDCEAKELAAEENQMITANVDIMDSEVSSISREEASSVNGEREAIKANGLDEYEDKNTGYRTPSCRISSDFEMAALSPCFPLIRDKEEPDIDSNLTNTERYDLNFRSLDNSPPKGEIIPLHERPVDALVPATEDELHIKSEPTDESTLTTKAFDDSFEQNEECVQAPDIDRDLRDAGSKKKEVKGEDENGSKDLNIVSSSLDKTEFSLDDKKDVWSALKDVWLVLLIFLF